MTDATAARQITERFGPEVFGMKFPSGPSRIAVIRKDSLGQVLPIGSGPTWEHAINEALAWKAAQR